MKKIVIGIVIVLVVAVVLGTAGYVYAQSGGPQNPFRGMGNGHGMMGGRGNTQDTPQGMMGNRDGVLHDEMIAAMAEKLGMTVSDLEARLTAGETMWDIAAEKDLTVEEFRTLMLEARAQAIDAAVLSGDLTQEQADWMKQRGAGMGGAGMRGNGQGRYGGMGCWDDDDQTTPEN